MDGRKNNGGKRDGAGRKPKAEELKLIEKLDNIIEKDEPIRQMLKLIKEGDFRAIQLYLNYRYGKPKEKGDLTSNEETISVPIVKFVSSDRD